MQTWTDSDGKLHTLPTITYPLAKRLKTLGVVDLLRVVNRNHEWEGLFDRLCEDGELIVSMCYVLEHPAAGSDEEQDAFARLFGDAGVIQEASQALQQAVIDFFPADHRDALRQLWTLHATETHLQSAMTVCHSAQSGSATAGSGANACWESSDMPETD